MNNKLTNVINQCVLNTLMTIKLCGGDHNLNEITMIRCVSSLLDQIVEDVYIDIDNIRDFDIDYYIEAYIEKMNTEDVNNDQKDV